MDNAPKMLIKWRFGEGQTPPHGGEQNGRSHDEGIVQVGAVQSACLFAHVERSRESRK